MSKVFLDTNVLVSSIDTTRPNHKKAFRLIEKSQRRTYKDLFQPRL